MTFPDIYRLANANLWRTKLRTALTTLGVIVGTGALVSMVSFGVGIQKNVTDELKKNDLFTTLEVTRTKINVQEMMAGDMSALTAPADTTTPPLDDAAVEKIRNLPGVEMAYPEIRFPAKIRLGSREATTSVQALPAAMVRYKPFSEVPYGSFFSTDDDRSVVLGQRVLRELGMRIDDGQEPKTSRLGEKELEGTVVVSPDSILGRELVIVTSVLDASNVLGAMMTGRMPVREEVTTLKVAGILGKPTGFGVGALAGGVIIPSATAGAIPRLGFSNVWELLSSSGNAAGYPSVSVRAKSMRDLENVRAGVEEMGFSVVTILDQLEEFKRGFLIMDALLGAIGTIALFVASLGIANTMVTSILERVREIGIMKAIGGSDGDIRGIFFVEAGTIGFVGGVLGILLGLGVSEIANTVANYYMRPEGVAPAHLFSMPFWLVLGALGFSVGVSLLAGLYPALRAARVDPVEALRHD
jgi:putative ABC transport system permease protein